MIPIKKEFLQEFFTGILEKGDPCLESPSEKNLIYSLFTLATARLAQRHLATPDESPSAALECLDNRQ